MVLIAMTFTSKFTKVITVVITLLSLMAIISGNGFIWPY